MKLINKYLWLLFVCGPAVAAAPDCYPTNRGMERMQTARIVLHNAAAQAVALDAFIADDNLERASGYQYICPRVIARTAILFRWDALLHSPFHMHNVKAPLDIGFFNADGLLLQTMTMQPYEDGREILYAPMQPFQYALEARRGFFAANKLSAGAARLRLETLP